MTGGIGAAIIWTVMNAGGLFISIPGMNFLAAGFNTRLLAIAVRADEPHRGPGSVSRHEVSPGIKSSVNGNVGTIGDPEAGSTAGVSEARRASMPVLLVGTTERPVFTGSKLVS